MPPSAFQFLPITWAPFQQPNLARSIYIFDALAMFAAGQRVALRVSVQLRLVGME